MRWSQTQRFAFIWRVLAEAGQINRSAIAEAFGVSILTASKDMGAFAEAFPGAVTYDTHARTFKTGPTYQAFKPPEDLADAATWRERYLVAESRALTAESRLEAIAAHVPDSVALRC
jgi:hypothetical protein